MNFEELKKKQFEQQEQLKREQELEMQVEALSRMLLSPEAKARLANVKLVNKELHLKAIQALLYLKQSGSIDGKISEEELKTLLEKLSAKRQAKIRRK